MSAAPVPSVAAVVLAAGTSSRWGSETPKQLAIWRGEPLVRHAVTVACASRACDVVVVTGHHATEVEEAVAGLRARLVRNPAYASGQASSIRAGVDALRDEVDGEIEGALFLPCDQPLLDTATLDLLIESFAALPGDRRERAVVPVHAGRRGSPALLGAGLFPGLAALEGDQGGRRLFGDLSDRLVEVELPSAASLEDVDTLDDLAALERRLPSPSPS